MRTPVNDPDLDPTSPLVPPTPRSRRQRLAAWGTAAALLSFGVGGAAVASSGDGGPSGYRTATVETAAVDQVLTLTGSVGAVQQASVAFPTSGTVAAVDVSVGDPVAVGQELASLDPSDLDAALVEARAARAEAELALEQALAGEPVTLGGTSGGSGADGVPAAAASSARTVVVQAPSSGPSGAEAEIAAAQQAVLEARQAVDAALATAEASLTVATEACAGLGASETGTEDDPEGGEAVLGESCRAALEQVLVDQQVVSDALGTLAEASTALDDLLARLADDLASPPADQDDTGAAPEGAPGGSGAPGATSGPTAPDPSASVGAAAEDTGSTSSPSAAELVAFQSSVDAASALVAAAEQALDQAEVVSPIDGVVASVGIDPGDEVGAASATQAIVVVGDGGFEVTASVTVDQLVDVEVGQAATVAVDGVDGTVRGEVVAIGGVAGTDGSTRTFPVTIALLDDADLLTGMVASIDVVVDGSADALTVPTSAVTTSGGTSTVTVLDDDGTTATVEVEVGAVGRDRTAIADGLDEGDEVVLADLARPLPSSRDDGGTEQGTGQDEGRGGPMAGEAPVGFQPPG